MAKRKKRKLAPPAPPPPSRPKLRLGRRALLLGALATGIALSATLVAVSSLTRGGAKTPVVNAAAASVADAPETRALLAGIPQHGNVLGSPRAPVTLVEYADPQCPYCAAWARDALPEIVQKYVRAGQVRIEFRGLSFIGPESRLGVAAALAAAKQAKLWHVIDLLYANQGVENGGWITNELIEEIADHSGLDRVRFGVDRKSADVDRAIDETTAQAQADAISGTPAFLVGPTGGALRRFEISSLDAAAMRPTLDELLAS